MKTPRVNEILDLMPGCKVESRFVSEEELSLKARFGIEAHRMFARAANRHGDWQAIERRLNKLPPTPLKNHVAMFYRFLRDAGVVPVYVERRLQTPAFSGQPDLILKNLKNEYWLVDCKTGKIQRPRHEAQLAAYSLLATAVLKLHIKRYSVLEVDADKYHVIDVPQNRIEEHEKGFAAACDLWHWKRRFA